MVKRMREWGIFMAVAKLVFVVVGCVFVWKFVGDVRTLRGQQQEIGEMIAEYSKRVEEYKAELGKDKEMIPSIDEGIVKEVYTSKRHYELLQRLTNNHLIWKNQNTQEDDIETAKLLSDIQNQQAIGQEENVIVQQLADHSRELNWRDRVKIIDSHKKLKEFEDSDVLNTFSLQKMNLNNVLINPDESKQRTYELTREEYRLQRKYSLSPLEKQMAYCVVVMMKDNTRGYDFQATLQSILNQNYINYHILLVDFGSVDATMQNSEVFLRRQKFPKERLNIMRVQTENSSFLEVQKGVRRYCDVEDVVVMMRGGDELLGTQAFSIISKVYKNKNASVVYTNYFSRGNDSIYAKGNASAYSQEELEGNNFKGNLKKFGHFHTFFSSLLLGVREQDLQAATHEQSYIIPILEMSCRRVEFINQYFYVSNYQHSLEQLQIQPRQPYTCLQPKTL